MFRAFRGELKSYANGAGGKWRRGVIHIPQTEMGDIETPQSVVCVMVSPGTEITAEQLAEKINACSRVAQMQNELREIKKEVYK